jgi:hypothetical protein
MKSEYLTAALLAIGAVAISVGTNSVDSSNYCPNPSAASVTALFAPCQTVDSAMGRSVTNPEAVQVGLLRLDLQAEPATQLADNLRSAPLLLREPQTVGLAKSGPKEIGLSR